MHSNNTILVLAGGIVLGAVITLGGYQLRGDGSETPAAIEEPMYWVAPMDPNYQRAKPGKSPMGMALVPVYENAAASDGMDAGPGMISISPEVVNNLGVRTALVERKTLHTKIKTVGYVKYDEDQLLHIHPRVEGWIDKLFVKASGDPVKQGQALYEIYSPALVNAQEELVLALARKNTRLIRAAKDRLTALQLPARAIEQLIKNRKVQQNVTFYSPQTGVLDNLNIRQGGYVMPGKRLMSIGVLDQVWVEAEVFEDQAASVTAGLPVTMMLDFLPGKLWQGRVDYVHPSLDVRTRTLKVRLRFDNDNGELKPNMFAQVAIHAKSDGDVLLIPTEAVIRSGSFDRAVLALGGGRYKSVEVSLGRKGQNTIEILKGLTVGDSIVTSAQFLLDSESSKTSDFKRMNYSLDDRVNAMTSVWTKATVNDVMAAHRMVNVSHGAISLWDWPAMSMDFIVSPNVDMNQLQKGITLQLEIQRNTVGSYEVVAAKSTASVMLTSANVAGVITQVMAGHRMLTIKREAIEKWKRPAATVDFFVDDNVNFSGLTQGMSIEFSFTVDKGVFTITDVQDTQTGAAAVDKESSND